MTPTLCSSVAACLEICFPSKHSRSTSTHRHAGHSNTDVRVKVSFPKRDSGRSLSDRFNITFRPQSQPDRPPRHRGIVISGPYQSQPQPRPDPPPTRPEITGLYPAPLRLHRKPTGSHQSQPKPPQPPKTRKHSKSSTKDESERWSKTYMKPDELKRPTPPETKDLSERFSKASMTRDELTELFNKLHAALEHVQYSICGLACLIDYGFRGRKASRISILVPSESKHTVGAWAKTRGFETTADSLAIPMRDGSFRRVRIKYLECGFDSLRLVRSSFSNAMILSIASLLDNVAAGYLQNRDHGDEVGMNTMAGDLFYCLNVIAARRERIFLGYLPTFSGEDFFTHFTKRYPRAQTEMARAGIDVATILKRHRAAKDLREHNRFLKQYGMRGDVMSHHPGQFEGLRGLKSTQIAESRTNTPPPRRPPTPNNNHLPAAPPRSSTHPARKPNVGTRKLRNETPKESGSERRAHSHTPRRANIGRSLTEPGKQHKPRPSEKPGPGWI
ncbi:hypothetical protein GGR51DRAFT_567090 [Nemania sp. FL0031]|nr:hypothetical protein GGR51DRAFT_567090 [Nemania sp. FL0031]